MKNKDNKLVCTFKKCEHDIAATWKCNLSFILVFLSSNFLEMYFNFYGFFGYGDW